MVNPEMINKVNNNKSLEKNIISFDYILKSTLNIILSILQGCTDVINDFLGNTNDTNTRGTTIILIAVVNPVPNIFKIPPTIIVSFI